MADPRICAIEGCNNPAPSNRKGWCQSHYHRWRTYGDPNAGQTAKGEAIRFLLEIAIPYTGDDCLLWPYSKIHDGRGQIRYRGKRFSTHRFVCEKVHGLPPTEKHHAAHSCGNGHLGCINPRHLRWATPKENNADKLEHGTTSRGERNAMSKLLAKDVIKIRSLKGDLSREGLAQMFGVSVTTIDDIQSGRRWSWLKSST